MEQLVWQDLLGWTGLIQRNSKVLTWLHKVCHHLTHILTGAAYVARALVRKQVLYPYTQQRASSLKLSFALYVDACIKLFLISAKRLDFQKSGRALMILHRSDPSNDTVQRVSHGHCRWEPGFKCYVPCVGLNVTVHVWFSHRSKLEKELVGFLRWGHTHHLRELGVHMFCALVHGW